METYGGHAKIGINMPSAIEMIARGSYFLKSCKWSIARLQVFGYFLVTGNYATY